MPADEEGSAARDLPPQPTVSKPTEAEELGAEVGLALQAYRSPTTVGVQGGGSLALPLDFSREW